MESPVPACLAAPPERVTGEAADVRTSYTPYRLYHCSPSPREPEAPRRRWLGRASRDRDRAPALVHLFRRCTVSAVMGTTPASAPTWLSVVPDAIPRDLIETDAWVVWRGE